MNLFAKENSGEGSFLKRSKNKPTPIITEFDQDKLENESLVSDDEEDE